MCTDCGRKLHCICVQHMDSIWPNGYTCDQCLKVKGAKRKDNRFTAKRKHLNTGHTVRSDGCVRSDGFLCETGIFAFLLVSVTKFSGTRFCIPRK